MTETAPVALTVSDLERAAGHIHAALKYARLTQALTATAGHRDAQGAAAISADESAKALDRLKIGGIVPAEFAPRTKPAVSAETSFGGGDALDLSALASLTAKDTPAARELLARLGEILPAAEALDRERGNWYEKAPASDTKGCDFAEDIYHLICRLELELSGPKSRRGE